MALQDVVSSVQTALNDVTELSLNKKVTRTVIETVVSSLIAQAKEEGKVSIPSIGTFKLKERAERQGRNPQSGEALTIAAKSVVVFKEAK